jgi:hypothetical protein
MNEPKREPESLHAAMATAMFNIDPGPDPQDPYERIVASSVGDDGRIDRGKYWRLFRDASPEVQLDAIAEGTGKHWGIVRSGLNVDRIGWLVFRAHYTDPAAEIVRAEALHGLRWVNYEEARAFLELTRDCDMDRTDLGFRILSEVLIAKIKNFDHKFFSDVAGMLKSRGVPKSEKPRGGAGSDMGVIFRAFCRLHTDTAGLPTREEVREECGFGSSDSAVKRAGRCLRDLGLAGLPEAKALSPSASNKVFQRAFGTLMRRIGNDNVTPRK